MKAWSYSQELGFILTWSNPKTRRGSGIYKLGGVKLGYKDAARQICEQAVSVVRWVSDVRCVGRPNRVGLLAVMTSVLYSGAVAKIFMSDVLRVGCPNPAGCPPKIATLSVT